jgi:hypothetical protein
MSPPPMHIVEGIGSADVLSARRTHRRFKN